MSEYTMNELFDIAVMKAKIGGEPTPPPQGGRHSPRRLWTIYGKGNRGGAHRANMAHILDAADELQRQAARHDKWLHAVVVELDRGEDTPLTRRVVYRTHPDAKAWWE